MKRLAVEDPRAVEYHLAKGQVVLWLEYANQKDLAQELFGVDNIAHAIPIIEKALVRSNMNRRMSQGRMH